MISVAAPENIFFLLLLFLQVSPTYSREISGNPLIASHLHKFHGILNGIDPDIWDPYNDTYIPVSGLPYHFEFFLTDGSWIEVLKF